jgi:hypothetical protein
MGRLPHDWERETETESVSRERAPVPPKQAAPAGSFAWASAIGNQAVQRLARQTVAREAVEEEEEVDEGAAAPEAVEGAVPIAEEAPPGDLAPEEAAEDAAPPGDLAPEAAAEDAAPPGDLAPEEAAGLAALDDLPEDELPE